MKIDVDFDRCEGHALCMDYAPKVFEVREDGYPYVLTYAVHPDEERAVQEAAASCPTQAITIE